MTIYKKLQTIQVKLKAPKSQFNGFGKYNYRNCEDILEAVKPLLQEEGCTMSIGDTIEMIGDRFYVKATVSVIDVESGEIFTTTALAREEESKKGMDGSQVTGAASSYARKYALNGMFLIDDTKDSDTTNTGTDKTETKKTTPPSTTTPPPTDPNLISDGQAKRLFAISNGKTQLVKEICLKYGYTSSKDIKKSDYEKIVKDIEQAS